MTGNPASLSGLISLSNLLQTLPAQRTSQVTNDAKSSLDPSQQAGGLGNFGPAYILDISANGMAHLNGHHTGENSAGTPSAPLQMATAADSD